MNPKVLPIGARVRALIGIPVRYGVVCRLWPTYNEYRITWDDGSTTMVGRKQIEIITTQED